MKIITMPKERRDEMEIIGIIFDALIPFVISLSIEISKAFVLLYTNLSQIKTFNNITIGDMFKVFVENPSTKIVIAGTVIILYYKLNKKIR